MKAVSYKCPHREKGCRTTRIASEGMGCSPTHAAMKSELHEAGVPLEPCGQDSGHMQSCLSIHQGSHPAGFCRKDLHRGQKDKPWAKKGSLETAGSQSGIQTQGMSATFWFYGKMEKLSQKQRLRRVNRRETTGRIFFPRTKNLKEKSSPQTKQN